MQHRQDRRSQAQAQTQTDIQTQAPVLADCRAEIRSLGVADATVAAAATDLSVRAASCAKPCDSPERRGARCFPSATRGRRHKSPWCAFCLPLSAYRFGTP
ncbi:hypothetical protein FB645_005887 [Coemansia sp. IMI 203386]|nr:hypothetical protein FB645_005887 [Coemansia sp. IMI 203386]